MNTFDPTDYYELISSKDLKELVDCLELAVSYWMEADYNVEYTMNGVGIHECNENRGRCEKILRRVKNDMP